MLEIRYSPESCQDLAGLRAYDRQRVLDAIDVQLTQQPTVEARNRKPMRENPIAQWELRVGSFRVLYDVDETEAAVLIKRIGYKRRDKLILP